MKKIILCEGLLGYSTMEIYTISESGLGTKGYIPSWAGSSSGVAIGRGYDFGASGDKDKTLYIFKELLKAEAKYLSLLEDDRLYVTQGGAAEILAKNLKNQGFQINTEQAFILFHASWSNTKRKAAIERFPKVFEHIYPPLREILISMSHSSGDDIVDKINDISNFSINFNPLEQCKQLINLFQKEIPKRKRDEHKGRYVERMLYADMLKRNLESNIEIEWWSLADIYLRDLEAEKNADATTTKEQALADLSPDFPWMNYNKGNCYEISLENFNLMLRDQQNKTLEFASSISAYRDVVLNAIYGITDTEAATIALGDTCLKLNYSFIEHFEYYNNADKKTKKRSHENILRLIINLAVKRRLNVIQPKLRQKYPEINILPIDLDATAHGVWDKATQKTWNAYQKTIWKKLDKFQTSYPDYFTMDSLFLGSSPSHANTEGTDKVNEVPIKLFPWYYYKLSENWNVLLDFSDINYLREILQNSSKKGDIKGSVGYQSDNYFRDVVVIRILLARKKGKDVFLMEQLKGAFSQLMWRLKLTTDAAPKDVILVVCDTLMEEQIKDFQRTVLGTTKPNGYIMPDSIELKKLNGE